MDITTVRAFRLAHTRDDLVLAPGEVVIAGGTWLMSEPQPAVTGFVDLTGMGWPDIEVAADGLRIGATCTIARLVAFAAEAPIEWTAASLIPDAANALLASFKIWNTATVGGNVCRAFAAGAMVSLCVALDGVAEIWSGAGDRELPVAELVTGNGTTALAPGEVLRSIRLPAAALRSRAALRKIALAEHGRSGAVVTGRVDPDGTSVFTVTAATWRPTVLRFPAVPDAAVLAAAVHGAAGYYTDPLGSADWRRGVSAVLAEEIRRELT
ncbi:FAD binding domain-containing protein [Microbacterium hominis]|uniref:FAD binding domain-containing protein n=1 Tax=Microbacterium TaxID=33882 RepID=UPI00168ADCA9|nr:MULTISPECIES: FAD binding domain-containing protein [Microbacterium]QOC26947.1 FAD binding domain-containing protein [Microbacterium hominis]QOC28111.1 FAD binding domain-containing protein [Microbacterium hominis]QYF96718.1 FAD binding domain-containing protein [Microbacterium sp. PAMC21962]